MLANASNLFYRICVQVQDKTYLEHLMLKLEDTFDITPYKINKLHAEIAKKIYNISRFKYEISKELEVSPDHWYENQRKLFVWFIVCYFNEFQNSESEEAKIITFQSSIDWSQVSKTFFGKNIALLKFQFNNILKQKNRISWTLEQDQLLCEAVKNTGEGCWNEISKYVYFKSGLTIFKTPKHCRERWHNHLDDSKKKGKWSMQQDYKMLTFVTEYGKKWSRIAEYLNHTRTEHMVKNRFNSLMTKVQKNKKQKEICTINKILQRMKISLTGSKSIPEKKMPPTELVSSELNLSISGQQIINFKHEIEDIEVQLKSEQKLISLAENSQFQRKTDVQNLFCSMKTQQNLDVQPVQSIVYNFLVPNPSYISSPVFFCYGVLPTTSYAIQNPNYFWPFVQENNQNGPTCLDQRSPCKVQPVLVIQQNDLAN